MGEKRRKVESFFSFFILLSYLCNRNYKDKSTKEIDMIESSVFNIGNIGYQGGVGTVGYIKIGASYTEGV